MVRLVMARSRSVSLTFIQAPKAVGSVKVAGISMSEFKLDSCSDQAQKPASDELCNRLFVMTISSSRNEPLRQGKGESKGRELDARAYSKPGTLGKWSKDRKHSRSKKGKDLVKAEHQKTVQIEESSDDFVERSGWSRLLEKLRRYALKFRPALSGRTTSQEPQRQQKQKACTLPSPKRIVRTVEGTDFRNVKTFQSKMLQVRSHSSSAVPLWQRRNVRRPAPLNSRKIRMNRSNRKARNPKGKKILGGWSFKGIFHGATRKI